ncbi:MAG: HDOD domain-containing protein [Phycisphaerales bacterium]
MPVETAAREQAVTAAIREISHIATLPEITLKIIQLVEDPKSTAQDLHQVISKDPALCTRILKVVNSAFYGLPGQIGSINRAIVLLGLNAVKNIAIAASLTKLFKGGDLAAGFSPKSLWTHSVAVGAASRMIATTMKLGVTDEAFLAGLLHDVGIMVELQFDRNKLGEVLTKYEAGQTNFLAVEEEVFSANHQDFGSGLCDKWKFPRPFACVTGFHHRPLDLPYDQRSLPTMVHIADLLAATLDSGFKLDLPSTEISSDVLDQLKLTREQIESVRLGLPDAIKEIGTMLSPA